MSALKYLYKLVLIVVLVTSACSQVGPIMVVFTCFQCQVNCAEFSTLLQHYRAGHGFGIDPQFKITCSINGCANIYSTSRTFSRDIKAKHEEFYIQNIQNAHINEEEDGMADDVGDINGEPMQFDQVPLDENHEVASFWLNLRENHKVPQTACTCVADTVSDIMKHCREDSAKEVGSVLQRSGANVAQLNENGLQDALSNSTYESAFLSFNSQRKLEQYVQAEYDFVEPVEIVLGREDVSGKQHTVQYVPILKTLCALLKSDEILGEIYGRHEQHVGDRLSDFCDGSNFKENLLFSNHPESLQIQLYYDEFTVANPLGTHVQKLKFSAV